MKVYYFVFQFQALYNYSTLHLTSLPILTGAVAPLGFFDPVGFTNDLDLNEIKRYREAEIMHGRVAMMATVGYLIGESTPTIAYGMDVHHTIANNQIPEVPVQVLFPFVLAIKLIKSIPF